ncbi:MAG: carboxypeptidase-like regulatory domain-containing protein [Terriglobales bacterium]|jgi:hypothetical protein
MKSLLIKVNWITLLLTFVFLFASSSLLCAQTVGGMKGGEIHGTVTDSTGAVIPGTVVHATNLATGVSTSGVTSSAGTYFITPLIPGQYKVAVEARGFERYEQTGVTVDIASQATVDCRLTPGAVTQTVQVNASASSLNTEEPSLGTTIEPELVTSSPLEISSVARQIDSFIFLAPGVQGNSSFSHNINGGVLFESEVQFNGIPVTQAETQGFQTNINPPYEMVNEFHVDSSSFSAQFGLAQGAVTYNMASGTDRLHADAFEILRNSLFDSDGFFPSNFNAAGKPAPPVDHENNYGFTVSGPIILPKVYNGKGKTFFLFSWDYYKENFAENKGASAIGTVPTTAMKGGDFSSFVNASGTQIPIYDPQTGQQFIYNGKPNVIPPSRFSTVSNTVLPMIPSPDLPGTNFGLLNNKKPAVASVPTTQDLWGYTIDHSFSEKQSIHWTEWRDKRQSEAFTWSPIVPPTNWLMSEQTTPYLGTGFLLNYAKTVRPNLVATAGADWIGEINDKHSPLTGVNFSGVQGSAIFPSVNFDGQNAITPWGISGGETESIYHKLGITIVNNWLWNKGRNTFNIGGEYRRAYQDTVECISCGGDINFSQRTTSTPNTSDPNFGSYGSSFASFLLGEVDSGYRVLANELYPRNRDISFYLQDDMKVNRRLTVNAGIRWDLMFPFTEEHNNIIYLNPTAPDPGAGNLAGAATKFGSCTGCAGVDRAILHKGHVAPRLGFSYMVTPKTVIQAGFYLAFLDGGAYEYGNSKVAVSYGNLLAGEFFRNSTGTSAPGFGDWDTSPMPLPAQTPFSTSMANGLLIQTFDTNKDGLAPYSQAWNVSVQRQLPWNMFLTVAYVGNREIHLPSQLNPPNQLNPSDLQYGSLLGAQVNSPAAQAAGIKIPYPEFLSQFGSSATVQQALLPFPQYSGVGHLFDQAGTTFYNAAQFQAEKRFSNGLSYLAAVTIGKNLSNVEEGFSSFESAPENKYNQKDFWVVSGLDQKYLTKVVTTYELPIGPGKPFLNSKRGLVGQLAGGWQISAILDYEGGTPFGPGENYSPLGGPDFPNTVSGVSIKTFSYQRTIDYFTGKTKTPPVQFTTNAFALTTPYALGDGMRHYPGLRNPPYRNENFNAMKHFTFGERVTGTLRVDYFNAFNRTVLQAPDADANDSTFGEITNTSQSNANRHGQATFRLEF